MPSNPTPAEVLARLDPEQRAVAEALRGPVRVLAGAGTGKTTAITHRLAHGVATGVYAPTEVLAVTFTTRAAGEMRQRLRLLGAGAVQARTFHSAALRQLRYFWPRAYGSDLPQLTESKFSLVALAARREGLTLDQTQLRDTAAEIEWAKVSNVTPERYAATAAARGREVAGLDPASVAHLLGAYEDVKREQGRMDMEDVLLLTAGMLAENEAVAAQVRRQYKWFTVDEFQDVSPIQSALLDLWLGGRNEVCVVGDPAQTIYSFAGADAGFLRSFPARFPGTTTVELTRNYRSTPEVVAAANAVLAGTPSQGVELRAMNPSGPAVRFEVQADEPSEAEFAANRMVELHGAGTPWSEMAVLFRINAHSENFEEALASRRIPYVVRGAARFFDRPEVREAVVRLKGQARAVSGAATGSALLDEVRGILAGLGWAETPPAGRGQTRDRWESWQALVDQAKDFAATSEEATFADFVDELDRRTAEQHAPAAAGVTLATLHAAKGLEWDAVFLAGLTEGSLPISFALDSPEAVEEERRLLYVGITRARRELTCTWALARNPGGQARRKPSRFLVPLLPQDQRPGERRDARRSPGAAGLTRRCACGRPLTTARDKKAGHHEECPAPYDAALYERLRAWRRERADDLGKPAFVIFGDATLQEIAARHPTTRRELLSVSGIGEAKLESYGDELLTLLLRD